MRNKFGLTRDIPADTKRAVRQRCGFGCVLCAGAIVEYEHFDPEFARARRHSADGITLLCPTCHAKKTRNLISVRRIRKANAAPAAMTVRYAFSDVEGTPRRPFVKLAGMTLKNCQVPLEVRGFPLLAIEDAEVERGPYRLSATFFNSAGAPSLFIRRNEWQVFADSWVVEVVGPSITVRQGPGQIALRTEFVPGEGLLVTRLEMLCGGYRLSGNVDTLEVRDPGGVGHSFTRCLSDGSKVGLSLA